MNKLFRPLIEAYKEKFSGVLDIRAADLVRTHAPCLNWKQLLVHQNEHDIQHWKNIFISKGANQNDIDFCLEQAHKELNDEKEDFKKIMSKKQQCNHNWVLDGHNCGESICSKCYQRPEGLKYNE